MLTFIWTPARRASRILFSVLGSRGGESDSVDAEEGIFQRDGCLWCLGIVAGGGLSLGSARIEYVDEQVEKHGLRE